MIQPILAAVVLIGDELLAGETQDLNLQFIAQQLAKVGIQIKESICIADDQETIIDKVKYYTSNYDYVFTTGGIGPTHDDITSLAIARVYNCELVENANAKKMITEQAKSKNRELKAEALKMALIPKGAELIENPYGGAPAFRKENCFVLPGVPVITQAMFPSILSSLTQGVMIYKTQIKVYTAESLIAQILSNIQEKYSTMSIGSYPNFEFVKVTIRGEESKLIELCTQEIIEQININNPEIKIIKAE